MESRRRRAPHLLHHVSVGCVISVTACTPNATSGTIPTGHAILRRKTITGALMVQTGIQEVTERKNSRGHPNGDDAQKPTIIRDDSIAKTKAAIRSQRFGAFDKPRFVT